MISEFLTWWGQQLLSLLPARASDRERDAVLVRPVGDDSLDVTVRRRGRDLAAGQFPLTESGAAALRRALGPHHPPITLRLPPGRLLEQPVTLPLAAERDPGQVLRYEMDRLTPFAAEELFWHWTLLRRDRERGQLHLRLLLVPRAAVSHLLDVLGQARATPVVLQGAAGAIPLTASRSGRWMRLASSALGVACLLLAVAATAIPFARQSLESRRIERSIAAARPLVDQVEALRRAAATTAAGIDVLAAERTRVGDSLALLATVTDALPDDTVLTDFTLRTRVLSLAGQSAAAARLIPALAAEPALRDPAFVAPVTRNEATSTEGFSLRAQAAP